MGKHVERQPGITPESLSGVIDRLKAGIDLADGRVYASSVKAGRFEAEQNADLRFQAGTDTCRLMHAAFFLGRGQTFLPWAELYNIEHPLVLGGNEVPFFDSDLESSLIQMVLGAIPAGGRIFVEYENDRETAKALELDVPAPASRMGYLLLQNGVTWYKDWYFPEGFMEGGRKLQGEKAVSPERKTRHLARIHREIRLFVQSRAVPEPGREQPADPADRAVLRAKRILEQLDPSGAGNASQV